MDIDRFLRDPLSRRRFFRMSGVSLAGGSAVFLTACGGDEGTPTSGGGVGGGVADAGGDEADIEILNSALDLELMAVAAYKAGARQLRGDVLDVGQTFLEQEQEHAEALASAVRELGGTPNRAKSSYEFPELSDQEDVLRFAVELENTAVAAYIDALPKISSAELRGTAAAILTNEAEHISVLLGALDMPQVPDAFVTGAA